MNPIETLKSIAQGARWWRNKKETKEEEKFLENFRRARLQSSSPLVIGAEPGSEQYRLCERLVSKGKLRRNGVAAYILPDDDTGADETSEQLG